jgi:hypothetical protein
VNPVKYVNYFDSVPLYIYALYFFVFDIGSGCRKFTKFTWFTRDFGE